MASITITTTGPQDARLAPAFGELLKGGGNATTAEVKTWLVAQLSGVVSAYEKRAAEKALAPPSVFTPT